MVDMAFSPFVTRHPAGAVSILFASSHQRGPVTVMGLIERRQALPAFSRKPLNVGMSDIAE
jgi:hypothetical protein